jgi:protein MYSM1
VAVQRLQRLAKADDFELLACRQYSSDPDAARASAPPFAVELGSAALLVCELHAHLSSNEVIGLLGGEWLPQERRLVVRRAFPCRSLRADDGSGEALDGGVEVEMDPSSEVELRAEVTACGLRVVGWYHTHPVFEPRPSVRDLRNQLNYQRLFRHAADGQAAAAAAPDATVAPSSSSSSSSSSPSSSSPSSSSSSAAAAAARARRGRG